MSRLPFRGDTVEVSTDQSPDIGSRVVIGSAVGAALWPITVLLVPAGVVMAGGGRTPSGWTLGSAVHAIKEVGHRVKDLTTAFVPDCPNWKVADERLTTIAAERLDIRLMRHLVETPAEAERLRFHGSPSILVDGVDVFAEPGSEVGLSCRRYLTPDGYEGAPTLEQLRAVLAGA